MKKLMILGAGVYQAPLIKCAKSMGIETIVVSPAGLYPGIALADIHVDLDTTDIEGVLSAAQEYSIDGITTTGADVGIPSMGKVVDALNLPGTGFDAAQCSTDKILMKQVFLDYSIPSAKFGIFTNITEAQEFADSLGYPVMVKAPDSSGSRGIKRADSQSALPEAWQHAVKVSRSGQVIIEAYLFGVEFGAQTFVHGNTVVAVFSHGDTVTPPPYSTPIGHSIPANLTTEQQEATVGVIKKAVGALGICDCISNIDLILVDGKPYILEIGARMGATCLPETISVHTGMDVYKHLIRLALGEYPKIQKLEHQANASLLLKSHKSGTVTRVLIPDEVINHPQLVEQQLDIFLGDDVSAFKVGPDRIGHLIVTADTATEAECLVELLASQIILEVKETSDTD